MEFATKPQAVFETLIEKGPAGNRWFKVNLHVHGQGINPAGFVEKAREAEIDVIAITDHQSFDSYEAIAKAARLPGRPLIVLPGIEITTLEGVHILAIFPIEFDRKMRGGFLGWLEISRSGSTRDSSNKPLLEILRKVDKEGGIIVVPHPFTDDIGVIASAAKIGTRVDWLNSGFIHLMQISEDVQDKIKYIGHDAEGNWVNRHVLASAGPQEIETSTYSLAPFNRSDSHKIEEICIGCSWFRMGEPSVVGLKQVAFEPSTRISLTAPSSRVHDCILAVKVKGGFCDGEVIEFSDGLNCLIGQNHAGKSGVFDFIRFGLGLESEGAEESKGVLLRRLYAILGEEGAVEIYLRKEGSLFLGRRVFKPIFSGGGTGQEVIGCREGPQFYQYFPKENKIDPAPDFTFPIELYEQGKINKLREDISRQLDMLDEFAGVGEFKCAREEVIEELNKSAVKLTPLYVQKEELNALIINLPGLKEEWEIKKKQMPDTEDQQKWASATGIADEIVETVEILQNALSDIPDPDVDDERGLDYLFWQQAPEFDRSEIAESKLIEDWVKILEKTLAKVESARKGIVGAIEELAKESAAFRKKWTKARDQYDRELHAKMEKVGVDSPSELISRIKTLESEIRKIENTLNPRLDKIIELISKEEEKRKKLLGELESMDREITELRKEKAQELTESLEERIKIDVSPSGNHEEYKQILRGIFDRITTKGRIIQNREQQIAAIVSNISPLNLARGIISQGKVLKDDGTEIPLFRACGITENTARVLLEVGSDINLLNELETVSRPDLPSILVRRKGESEYGDLRTGLSPGEQSAAILTLALQTRSMPLIVDQPEDELGYSFVVHLVVPKVLNAKSSRQILAITHNANIPVLGDADFIIKMENKPNPQGGRRCTATARGCFEAREITSALLELEGGQRAFEFRQHRYTLPRLQA